jgi:hypothetical protein
MPPNGPSWRTEHRRKFLDSVENPNDYVEVNLPSVEIISVIMFVIVLDNLFWYDKKACQIDLIQCIEAKSFNIVFAMISVV